MAMLLKRKRSASELCSPPSADNSMMDVSAPANLHSRTLKRYRDNRPSDEEVHRKFYEWRAHHHLSTPNSSSCAPAEHTLGLLYSAQQRQQGQPHPQDPIAAHLPPPQQPAPSAENPDSQQSLHRFWNISSEPSSGSSSPGIANPSVPPTSCEDCGSSLAGGNDDEMEVDSGAVEDTACGACGKHVCFSCSVSNLGEQKRCLQCAGRRVWIGGIGWTNAGVPVC
ncbi:hypothetical protein TARUN_3496 [Trichoderma arundinaceum]|uniref:Uncharacterized protein n=1 Tax=Trichoderma arundinaceum TaxID=490622 RepID=A0A395NRS3_TRIAR|nr:hypothetical protein TARUN_3496 [Trichoderma arundinaceum]